MSKLSTVLEMGRALGRRKRYALIPFVTVLLALGLVLVLAEGSAVGPFIYTLF